MEGEIKHGVSTINREIHPNACVGGDVVKKIK